MRFRPTLGALAGRGKVADREARIKDLHVLRHYYLSKWYLGPDGIKGPQPPELKAIRRTLDWLQGPEIREMDRRHEKLIRRVLTAIDRINDAVVAAGGIPWVRPGTFPECGNPPTCSKVK